MSLLMPRQASGARYSGVPMSSPSEPRLLP